MNESDGVVHQIHRGRSIGSILDLVKAQGKLVDVTAPDRARWRDPGISRARTHNTSVYVAMTGGGVTEC